MKTPEPFNKNTNPVDIIEMIVKGLQTNADDIVVDIHDKLLISDFQLMYDTVLIFRILQDYLKKPLYFDFAAKTANSKLDPKGIFHKSLDASPIYTSFGNTGYKCVLNGKTVFFKEFAMDIIRGTHNDSEAREAYWNYTVKNRKINIEKIAKRINKATK